MGVCGCYMLLIEKKSSCGVVYIAPLLELGGATIHVKGLYNSSR